MVTSAIQPTEIQLNEPHQSLEEWMLNPPEEMEWVDGQLV